MTISFKRLVLFILTLLLVLLFTLNLVLMNCMYGNSKESTFVLREVIDMKHKSDTSSDSDRLGGHSDNLANSSGNKLSPQKKRNESVLSDSVVLPQKDPAMNFTDVSVDNLISKFKQQGLLPSDFFQVSLATLVQRYGTRARKAAQGLSGYDEAENKSALHHWQLFHRSIKRYSLYDPADPAIDGLLHDLATLPIRSISDNDGGTQLKLNLKFTDGGRGVFKPMRYPREVEANPNNYIFDDIERHVAEIAAFQLDRLLGFYRVPPTIGRRVNLTSEIRPLVPDVIGKTFYTSPAGNICFFGECDYYCDSGHAFCGNPDTLEGSVMSYLPSRLIAGRYSWDQPWRRSYSKFRKAVWEKDESYCDRVRTESPFDNGKILLDLIDVHVFDFLTGNKDRHSITTFKEFGNYSFPILFDNGRGFGRQTYDAMSILAPLRQCCVMRKSTFVKLVKLYTGPERLSDLMKEALASDPVAPILLPGHLNALDRRLVKILRTVAGCIEKGKFFSQVIKFDKF